MLVRLEVAHKKANVKKVVLKSDTVIGRGADCNLRIASNEVSRRHCSILVSASSVFVRDLGSSNGTFVNGKRIEALTDVPLNPGSRLSIGDVRFVAQFHVPGDENDPGSTVDFSADKLKKPIAELASRKPATETVKPVSETVQLIAETTEPVPAAEAPNSGVEKEEVPTNPALAETRPFVPADRNQPENDVAVSAKSPENRTPDSPVGEPAEEEPAIPLNFPQMNDSVAAGETISMNVEQPLEPREAGFPADTISIAVPDVGAVPDVESVDAATDRRKRWSLFGLFRRQRKAVDADSVEPAVESDVVESDVVESDVVESEKEGESAEENSVEPADVDTLQISLEDTLFERQNTNAAIPADNDDSFANLAEAIDIDPESHSPAEAKPDSNETEDDDPAWGDFLNHMP